VPSVSQVVRLDTKDTYITSRKSQSCSQLYAAQDAKTVYYGAIATELFYTSSFPNYGKAGRRNTGRPAKPNVTRRETSPLWPLQTCDIRSMSKFDVLFAEPHRSLETRSTPSRKGFIERGSNATVRSTHGVATDSSGKEMQGIIENMHQLKLHTILGGF
jgi:hypothetical protein